MTGRFLTQPRARTRSRLRPWYQKRPYQVAVAAVVVATAVVTDRYDHYDPVQQQHRLTSLASTVRSDLQFCRDGVALVERRWAALPADATVAQRRQVGTIAGDAEPSCTPVGQDGGVYSLASLQPTRGLPHTNELTQALYDATEWAYPSAARYLLAVETLARNPGDAGAELQATDAQQSMRSFRSEADALVAKVAHGLAMSKAPSLGLPRT